MGFKVESVRNQLLFSIDILKEYVLYTQFNVNNYGRPLTANIE